MPFRDIVGHRRTLRLLSRAVLSGTLPPSLLFAGPDGIGKRQVAVALAQTLNCLSPVRDVALGDSAAATLLPIDACGECAACRRIARGVHPDVIALTPEGDRVTVAIDQVRALNEQIAYRPFEGRRRVVIVDEAADVLLGPSQNALLKTLEEPPSGTVFVLVTSRPDALLPTVRSRCPAIRFAPLSGTEVVQFLTSTGMKAAEAATRAAVADGSIGRALAAAELADVRDGARQMLEQVARARDTRARLEATKAIAGKGKGTGLGERDALAVHLRLLHALLRDLGVLSTSADERGLANADLQPLLSRLAPAFDRARLVRAFTAIDRALDALERNASPKIVADWVALQL
jgi:DNA polymerase-3 subunit delta'